MLRALALCVLSLITMPACGQSGDDRVTMVRADDAEMNAAISKARATVGTFITALRTRNRAQSALSVKVPIADGDDVEHFWLSNVSYDGALFHGDIANDPQTVKKVKFGQPVSVRPTEISDWMYVDNGRLVGGYTLRLLRERMSPSERAEFDERAPFRVEK